MKKHFSLVKILASIFPSLCAAGSSGPTGPSAVSLSRRMLLRGAAVAPAFPSHTGVNQPGTFGRFRNCRRAAKNCDRMAFAMGTRRRVRI